MDINYQIFIIWDCVEFYTVRTCFVSFMQDRITTKKIIIFLSDQYHPTYTFLTSRNLVRFHCSRLLQDCSGHFEFKTLWSPTIVQLLLVVPRMK